MPASEIDEIFAGKTTSVAVTAPSINAKIKGKAKAVDKLLATTSASSLEGKKREKRKRKLEGRDDGGDKRDEVKDPNDEASLAKTKKKRKKDNDANEVASSTSIPVQIQAPAKRVPETVFDPSVHVSGDPSKKSKRLTTSSLSSKADKAKMGETEDIKRFKDSRGTGPRMSRHQIIIILESLSCFYRTPNGRWVPNL